MSMSRVGAAHHHALFMLFSAEQPFIKLAFENG